MSKSRDIADSAATINYIDNVTSDVQSQINTLDTALDNISVTSGTLTKTFANGESASISLTSSVLAPVVSVTKEVPQSGVTNNNWDVNSTTENYTRLNSAYATTLDFLGSENVDNLSYSSKSFSGTSQSNNFSGLIISTDGTKMYGSDYNSRTIYQYSLSTAGDITTASYDSKSFNHGKASVLGIAIKSDGTKLFVLDFDTDALYQYTLSTAYDISTAGSATSFSVSSQAGSALGIYFKPDGTKFYITNNTTDSIYQYSMSTAWDVTTASYDSKSVSVTSQASNTQSVNFTSDGETMYVNDYISNNIYQYTLTTAWDVSTASYASKSFNFAQVTGNSRSVQLYSDNLYVTDNSNSVVYQYNAARVLTLGTGSFASADVGKTIEANSGEFVLTATDGSYVETTAPISYDQVASGSWEMYGVVYNSTDGDLELSGITDPATTFDVSTAVYSQSFSVAAEESFSVGLAFNTNGTKMFVAGNAGQDVNEYTLSTGFDVSTASFVDSFNVSAQDTSPVGLAFNITGTKMFVLGNSGGDVNEYILSIAFDVSTASFVDSFSVASQEGAPRGIAFNTDGTKMYVVGQVGQDVNEYTLSTGFDVSTASFVDSFSVSAQDTVPWGITFNTDGTKMFIVGATGDAVYEYTLSTGFDVSTASFVDSFSVASQDINPVGIAFNSSGSKMFILGTTGDSVYEYTIGTTATPTGYHPVHTTASTDTTYWTDINSMTADQNAGDGNVYYAISTDDRTTWTVIDNTDGERDIVRNNAGTWQYNSNGTYASETWTNATTNTELAALAEAMEGAADGYSLSAASYDSVSFDLSSQTLSPTALRFNSDGTKMFVLSASYLNTQVYEYTLSSGFDPSTAVFVDGFDVAAQDTSPKGLDFNSDGTKMFVLGNTGQDVNEYTLSTGFDVSTASFVDSFSVSAQVSQPRGLCFSADGSKMFVTGSSADSVFEYSLSIAFDVSTSSYSQSFSVASQDTEPQNLAFNSDGTKMYIMGSTGDDVNEYTLSTGFDVSTATYAQNFSVSSQETSPRGITFNSNGTKMFICGEGNDSVYQYSTGSFANQMDKTQLDAVTDPNHIALGDDLDLAIIFNMTSGSTVPSSDGVAINYDANVLNKGAVLGTDYDFDAPTQNSVRITALAANNLKVRVV